MNQAVFCTGLMQETALYQAVEAHMTAAFPGITIKHDRTQTAFVRKVQFAWVSLPRRKADAGAVVLSFGLPSRLDSKRILHCSEVTPGRWMHHMLLHDTTELNGEVHAWLEAAWALVGCGRRNHS